MPGFDIMVKLTTIFQRERYILKDEHKTKKQLLEELREQ
jgi:hypothetical protein